MSAPIATPSPQLARVLAALGDRVRGMTGHDHTARCPAHEDQRASLTVADGRSGVVLRCHAGCAPRAIVDALGLAWGDLFPPKRKSTGQITGQPVAAYPYLDEQGELLFEVVRFEPKDFRQRRPDPAGKGGWTWSLKGVRRVLYHLPAVLEAARAGGCVFVVEGEKDVHSLEKIGLVATTNPGGAGSGKWLAAYSESLRGAGRLVVIADKDEPGRKHAAQVAASISQVVPDVRVLELPGGGKDADDWVAAGGTAEQLQALVEAVPPWEPGAAPILTRAGEKAMPEIVVGHNVREMVDQAEAALADSGRDVFHRGGELVGLVTVEGRMRIRALPLPSLLELLSDVACWSIMRQTKDGPVPAPCKPPRDAVEALAARGSWTRLRGLVQVADCPSLRPDGSLIQTPGYDPAARVFYAPSQAFPTVPEQPTKDEALAALEALQDLVIDFPFVEFCDRAAWVGLVLTLVGRRAIAGPVPMFLIRANAPSSGKGKLVTVAALIATGEEPSVMAQGGKDPSEEEKRLVALGRDGAQVALLDNCERLIGSDVLAAALTARQFRGRVLGSSTMVSFELPTFCATANNGAVAGDLGRRVVPIDLRSQEEFPEERTGFKHPHLEAHVRANRPALLVAALTVLRWFFSESRPAAPLPPFGSFEAWSGLVRDCLVYLGQPDPAEGRSRIRSEGDPARLDRIGLLAALVETFGPMAFTASDVVVRARNGEDGHDLRHAIVSLIPRWKADAENAAVEIGRLFDAVKDWKQGGRRLVKASSKRGKRGWTWKVETLEAEVQS